MRADNAGSKPVQAQQAPKAEQAGNKAQSKPDQKPDQQQSRFNESRFEQAKGRDPVNLTGAPRNEPDQLKANQTQATTAVQNAQRPETAVNPDKVGVALNDDPKLLPTGDELKQLGVTGARITLNSNNFRPDDTQNVADWQAKLQDYRKHDIDVTLNLPREIDGSGTFPSPAKTPTEFVDGQPALYEDGQPKHFAASSEQSEEWNKQFDTWKKDHYLPQVKQVIDKISTVPNDESVPAEDRGKPLVHSFEVWNEPDEQWNDSHGYAPGIPSKAFGGVLKDVYGMVHGPGADPNVPPTDGKRIISGGLDSGQPGYLDDAFIDGKLYADAVGVHPYMKKPTADYDPTHPQDGDKWYGTVNTITNDYSNYLNGKGITDKPIVFTEAGDKRGYDDDQSAEHQSESRLYTPLFGAMAGKESRVERSYFFWQDPHDGRFALTDGRDAQGKPQYRSSGRELQQRIKEWNAPDPAPNPAPTV